MLLRTVELLGEKAKGAVIAMEACLKRAYAVRRPTFPQLLYFLGDQDMAMFVGFSCNAILAKNKVSQKRHSNSTHGCPREAGVAELIHQSTNSWYLANGKDAILKGLHQKPCFFARFMRISTRDAAL